MEGTGKRGERTKRIDGNERRRGVKWERANMKEGGRRTGGREKGINEERVKE